MTTARVAARLGQFLVTVVGVFFGEWLLFTVWPNVSNGELAIMYAGIIWSACWWTTWRHKG